MLASLLAIGFVVLMVALILVIATVSSGFCQSPRFVF